MPSYKFQLKSSMKCYPSIFMDENDFLKHSFFVNGNGLEWVNGELTDKIKHKARFKDATAQGFTFRDDDKELKYRRGNICRCDKAKIDECYCCWFANTDGSIASRMYPICEYAKIMHLPDDIKPDWLDAAKRAIEWAESPLCRMTKEDEEYIAKAKERIVELENK